MVTIYADVHVGIRAVDALQQQGRPLGLAIERFAVHGQDDLDPEHLLRAAHNGWTILTRDMGFLRLQDLWYVANLWRPAVPPLQHAGILCVMSNVIEETAVVAAVLNLVAARPTMADTVFTLEGPPHSPTWRHYRPFARKPRPLVRT